MTAPATTPPVQPWASKRQRLQKLHSSLVVERSSWISHWQDINRVLFPRRGRFTVTDTNRGDRRNREIIDSTATFAARTLGSGMMSGITSPARDWFRLTTPDAKLAEVASVKAWLHETTDAIKTILLKSNFYDQIHALYGTMGVYATAAMLIDEDDEDVIRCHTFPIGSFCLANDEKGRGRVFTREIPMTVRQLVLQFGYERCSPDVQAMWTAGNLDAWRSAIHVIEANAEYHTGRLDAKYKRWGSCYFEQTGTATPDDRFLRESGYDEYPLLVGRWDVTDGDAYGSESPGMIALGDITQLQHGEKKGLQALDKLVSPPLVAPPGLRNEPISQLPGGVTFDEADEKRGLRALHEIKPDLDKLEGKQAQVRERIREAFYANLFLSTSYLDELGGKQPVTAAEINERREEKLLALGPVLGRLDKDVLNVAIDRVFGIAVRAGRVPPAPPELEGSELKVEYISIMHAAQKAAGLGQIERFTLFCTQLATAAQDPTVLDRLDTDETIESYHDLSGVPPKLVRSDADVAAIREQRQKASRAQAAAEQVQQLGAGAKALAGADTSGQNALTDILSQIGAPPA